MESSQAPFILNLQHAWGWMFAGPVVEKFAARHPEIDQVVWFHGHDATVEEKSAFLERARSLGVRRAGRPRIDEARNAALYWTPEFASPDFVPPLHLPRVQIFHSSAVHKGWVFSRLQRVFSHFFITGPVSMEYFEELVRPIHPGAHVFPVGYPKIDALVKKRFDRDALRRYFNVAADRPVILYAPTHGCTNKAYSAEMLQSSADVMGVRIIRSLLEIDCTVILRMHPWSLGSGSLGFDYRKAFEDFFTHPHFRWDTTGNSNDALAIADLLVADCGGIVPEGVAADLPIVLMDIPEHFRQNRKWDTPARGDAEEYIRPFIADVVSTIKEMKEMVALNLAHPERRAADRAAWRPRLFYNLGAASDEACRVLKEIADGRHPIDAGRAWIFTERWTAPA